MISLNCPACGKIVQADPMRAGQTENCLHCGAAFTVPGGVMPPKKTNVGLIIGIVVCSGLCLCSIPVIIAVVLPAFTRTSGVSNERMTSATLKSAVTAEEVFRANDLDRNAVADYWTVNVAGLYCIKQTDTGNAIGALPDIGMASADLDARNADAVAYSGTGTAYDPALLLTHAPKAGYFYQTLRNDENGAAYNDDTDGTGRKIHSVSGFGFAAIPAEWDSTGTHVFIANADATVYRRDFGASTLKPAGSPLSTFDGSEPLDFPGPANLSANWGKVE